MEPADLALVNTVNRSALHLAVRDRNLNIVGRLARHMRPGDLAIQDDSGSTALASCAEQGEEELVEVLVSRMTVETVWRQDHAGDTALHLAAYYAEQRCVDILLSSMASEDLTIPDKMGATPLHLTMLKQKTHGEGTIKVLSAFAISQSNELVARSILERMDCRDLGVQDSSQRKVLQVALT